MNVEDLIFSKANDKEKDNIIPMIQNKFKSSSITSLILMIIMISIIVGSVINSLYKFFILKDKSAIDSYFYAVIVILIIVVVPLIYSFIKNKRYSSISSDDIELLNVKIKMIHTYRSKNDYSNNYSYRFELETLSKEQIFYNKNKNFICISDDDKNLQMGDEVVLVKYQIKSKEEKYNYVIVSKNN